MEVRCGNCHKLFRVSDDKISGKGIKFVCTRCGVYVRITIEDFSTYTLSKSAVSVLDLFEEKPRQATSEIGLRVEQTAEAATTPARMAPETAATEPTMEATAGEDFLKSPIPDFFDEKKEPVAVDRSSFEEPASEAAPLPESEPESPAKTESQTEKSEIPQSEQEKMPVPEPETKATAMTVEMPEPESGTTPTLAVGEDTHHAFEQQPEPQPEQETDTFLAMQVAVPEAAEPGIAAGGEAIDAVQPAPEHEPELQLKPDSETVKEPVAAAEPEPVVPLAIEKTEEAQLKLEQRPESQQEPKTEMAVEPAAAPEREPASTSPSETPGTDQGKQKPEPETKAAVMLAAVAELDIRSEPKTAAIPSGRQQPAQNTPPYQTGSQPVRPPKPAVPAGQALKKESSQRLSQASSPVIGASPTESRRSGNRAMIMGVAVIILVLVGFGAYMFLRSPGPSSNGSAAHMISIEGLRITNAAGSLEPNGDLLISGVVENSTDKPQPAWLVVVDVYDAKGTVINKMKLLNGKQLYSRSDYAILAKRGASVQEMKANALQEQGTVIPPKDKVTFEIRYLEPPAGIASFSATLQPFDPARLSKETEDETK
jgi:predicted Zn finger-like uncharacterized protein